MNLDKIIAISGRPGLYEMVTQTRNSIIAVSLVDGKRISTGISHQLSVLSEIQIYGLHGEVPLIEILEKIFTHENGQATRVKPKAGASDLEAYFFDVFSDYDEERVYPSDIKKIIQWYNILLKKNLLVFSEASAEEPIEKEDTPNVTNESPSEENLAAE